VQRGTAQVSPATMAQAGLPAIQLAAEEQESNIQWNGAAPHRRGKRFRVHERPPAKPAFSSAGPQALHLRNAGTMRCPRLTTKDQKA
jgi:hypothetical protein